MQGTLFIKNDKIEAFPMPKSYREPQQPGNIKVVRLSVFSSPTNEEQGVSVTAFSKWLSRTKTGYFDRVGGNPVTGERCTEFIILHEKSKIVSDRLNILSLCYSLAEPQSMLAREKSRFGAKTVKK